MLILTLNIKTVLSSGVDGVYVRAKIQTSKEGKANKQTRRAPFPFGPADYVIIREFKQPRRRRQLQREKTIGFNAQNNGSARAFYI